MSVDEYSKRPEQAESEQLFFGAEPLFEQIFTEIDEARETISVELYILELDRFGRRFCDRLISAARRGVDVKLVVDGFGSSGLTIYDIEYLESQGVQIRVFNPVPLPWNLLSFGTLFQAAQFARSLFFFNRRMHKKVYLFDRKRAYVGGMNVTQSSFSWRDTAVVADGPEVTVIVAAFAWIWNRACAFSDRSGNRLSVPKIPMRSALIRLNHNWLLRRGNLQSLLERIRSAEREIMITNAYFVPTSRVLRALKTAAKNGVRVILLLPQKTDVPITRWVRKNYQAELIQSGVQIYEYMPRVLHAKSMSIDDWAIVGSSNLNYRSLLHDIEIDVVLQTTMARQKLQHQFELDLKNSERVDPDADYRGNIFQFIAVRLLYYLRYWM